MIVFNAESAFYASKLFESESVHLPSDVFFNDGLINRRVVHVRKINQDFESNGMFQSILSGVELDLEGGGKVDVNILKSSVRVIDGDTLPISKKRTVSDADASSLSEWVDAGINKYMF